MASLNRRSEAGQESSSAGMGCATEVPRSLLDVEGLGIRRPVCKFCSDGGRILVVSTYRRKAKIATLEASEPSFM